jgi:di/tricarboxylate transporter
LAALLAAIVLSCFTPVHIGILSAAVAFLIGHFAAGMKPQAVAAGFPITLFLTLAGITLLFSIAQVNGTLDQFARRSVRLARGNRGLIPLVFFALAVVLGAIGPGGIAASALLAPVALPIAVECGISPLLMIVMLANGANAGTFSPIAPTGIIAHGLMEKIGLANQAWPNFWNTLMAQSVAALGGFVVLGGWRLFGRSAVEAKQMPIVDFDSKQYITLAVIGLLVIAVIGFGADVGAAAFVAASLLGLARAADEDRVWKAAPWSVIFLVCGVTMLVSIAEKTGGMDLFTSLLARLASPSTIPGVMALVTGFVSVYSSSSGVVMPAFLPAIPGLVEKLGGGNPLMIAYSVNVGAHLVDVSPLSTIGALCLAGVPPSENRGVVFRQLLIWGWSMSVIGAIICQLLFGYR